MKRIIMNMRALRFSLLLAGAILLTFSIQSCEKHVIIFDEVEYETFSSSIQPIFTSKCVQCHSGNLNPNLSSGSSYVSLTSGNYIDTDNPESSVLYEKLTGSHKTYVNDEQRGLILDWITAGAPND